MRRAETREAHSTQATARRLRPPVRRNIISTRVHSAQAARVPRCGVVSASAPPQDTSAYGSCGPARHAASADDVTTPAETRCSRPAWILSLRQVAGIQRHNLQRRHGERRGATRTARGRRVRYACSKQRRLPAACTARRRSAWRRSSATCLRWRCACRTAAANASCAAAATTSFWCVVAASRAGCRTRAQDADLARAAAQQARGERSETRLELLAERARRYLRCVATSRGRGAPAPRLTRVCAHAARRRRGGASGWAPSRGRCLQRRRLRRQPELPPARREGQQRTRRAAQQLRLHRQLRGGATRHLRRTLRRSAPRHAPTLTLHSQAERAARRTRPHTACRVDRPAPP